VPRRGRVTHSPASGASPPNSCSRRTVVCKQSLRRRPSKKAPAAASRCTAANNPHERPQERPHPCPPACGSMPKGGRVAKGTRSRSGGAAGRARRHGQAVSRSIGPGHLGNRPAAARLRRSRIGPGLIRSLRRYGRHGLAPEPTKPVAQDDQHDDHGSDHVPKTPVSEVHRCSLLNSLGQPCGPIPACPRAVAPGVARDARHSTFEKPSPGRGGAGRRYAASASGGGVGCGSSSAVSVSFSRSLAARLSSSPRRPRRMSSAF